MVFCLYSAGVINVPSTEAWRISYQANECITWLCSFDCEMLLCIVSSWNNIANAWFDTLHTWNLISPFAVTLRLRERVIANIAVLGLPSSWMLGEQKCVFQPVSMSPSPPLPSPSQSIKKELPASQYCEVCILKGWLSREKKSLEGSRRMKFTHNVD